MAISMQDTAQRARGENGGIAAWILDRLLDLRNSKAIEKRQLHLLETLTLGGKRQLMLVLCGNQRCLVGLGADGVESIVLVPADTIDSSRCSAGSAP